MNKDIKICKGRYVFIFVIEKMIGEEDEEEKDEVKNIKK